MYFSDFWFLKDIKKNLPYFIFCLAFIFLFLDPIPGGDALNYYALTSSLFHDWDIDLTNQAQIIYPEFTVEDFKQQIISGEIEKYNELLKWNGKFLYSDHTPGFSLLVLPVYAVCNLLGNFSLFHILDNYFYSIRKDILINLIAPSITNLLLFILGFIFTIRLLEYFKVENSGLWFTIGFLSTNFFHYASVDSAYPLVAEFAFFSIFLYYFFKSQKIFLQGLSLGILILIKPYFLGITLLVFAYKLWIKEKSIWQFVFPILIFLGLWGFYNNAIFGSPFETGFNQSFISSFTANFCLIPLNFLSIFFSPINGLFFFTPFFLLGFVGLLYLFFKEIFSGKITKKSLLFLFLFGYLLFFSTQTFWAERGSYAHKTLAFFFPLLVIGANKIKTKFNLPLWIFYFIIIYTFVIWILFLNQTYNSDFIFLISNWHSFFPISEISFFRIYSIL